MELINVAAEIEKRIDLLSSGRKLLKERADAKSKATSNYEKKIAQTIIKLKNDIEMSIDDDKIQSPPATIMEKIARGICWEERLTMDSADMDYKNALVGMDSICAELNGWQSIYRHLSEK